MDSLNLDTDKPFPDCLLTMIYLAFDSLAPGGCGDSPACQPPDVKTPANHSS